MHNTYLFFICFYKYPIHRKCFSRYKLLAEWLGTYRYIYPSNRELHPRILSLTPRVSSSLDVYLWWESLVAIETCLDLNEQEMLCQMILILESNNSRIPLS